MKRAWTGWKKGPYWIKKALTWLQKAMEKSLSKTEIKNLSALFWFQKMHKSTFSHLEISTRAYGKHHLHSNQCSWATMVASDQRTPCASWKHEIHISFCKNSFITWCPASQWKKQRKLLVFYEKTLCLTRKYSTDMSIKTCFSWQECSTGNHQLHMVYIAPEKNCIKEWQRK